MIVVRFDLLFPYGDGDYDPLTVFGRVPAVPRKGEEVWFGDNAFEVHNIVHQIGPGVLVVLSDLPFDSSLVRKRSKEEALKLQADLESKIRDGAFPDWEVVPPESA